MISEFAGEATPLDEKSMSEVAEQLGADAVRIWTVIHVETCGCGFLSDRRPNILFERHIFHRLTKGRYDAVAPDLSNADSGGYGAQGAHQHDGLARAMSFDRQAALCSASWGIGQIMGSNAKSAGWADVEFMVKAMMQTEGAQLRGMAGFIRHNGLDRALCSKNWTAFARGYNGEAYAKNQYDRRLAAAHEMYRIGPLPDLLVRTAQLYLTYLGYQPGRVDGRFGRFTCSALNEFQQATRRPITDTIDDATLEAMRKAVDTRQPVIVSA